MSEPEIPICKPGGGGTFFPLLEAEQTWSDKVRAAIYAALLIYVFLGVSIVADTFMDSIEEITSEKRRVKSKKTGNIVTVRRWNDTVSNLTLMALGSSAPEILLSIMEMFNNDFYSGELGPSTIVGSAAFNLFVIIGVCIVSIPSPQTRSIKAYTVFVITAAFSIFAYLWLVFIVQVNTPDVIEAWEGWTTLAFFPILILISYMADIGLLDRPDHSAHALLKDVEAPQLQEEREKREIKTAKPICDLQGKVIRNAPGVLSFSEETFRFTPEDKQDKSVTVDVLRCNGTSVAVTCKYKTEKLTAVPGYDYTETSGVLRFENGENKKQITVHLKPNKSWKRSDEFQIILSDATGGVLFNPNDDGGEETCVATVTIGHRSDTELLRSQSDGMLRMIDFCCNIDSCARACSEWREQIKSALCDVSGDEDDGEENDDRDRLHKQRNWSGFDMFMHIVSLPWKLVFAVVIPPVELSGGWACFGTSLACIGAVTSVIIDLAELFGCVVGLEDSVVAITFVALGTSMPDLFASWKEAVESPDADASIVNVTGSNSVNVFLGIGIPWTMAAMYWEFEEPTLKWRTMYPNFLSRHPDGAFIVIGGNLVFSVVVFTLSAAIACLVLWARRKYIGGELGGPAGTKILSGLLFFMLWLFYIFLSIWKTQSPDATTGKQVFAVGVSLCVLQNALLFLGGGLVLFCSRRSRTIAQAGQGCGSEEQVRVPALKQRGMLMEDLGVVLKEVESQQELRDAVLDPNSFVQKLATVEGSDTLNSAARILAIAQLRPVMEADVYKLHGLSWEDFVRVLKQVDLLSVLRNAAMEPNLFLEGLENGEPLEAAKELFVRKFLVVIAPHRSRLDLSGDDIEAVAAAMVSGDSLDQIKQAIADPDSLVRGLQSREGVASHLSPDAQNIFAMVKCRSLLESRFAELGLTWSHALSTVRQMCDADKDTKQALESFLGCRVKDATSTTNFVTMISNCAKEPFAYMDGSRSVTRNNSWTASSKNSRSSASFRNGSDLFAASQGSRGLQDFEAVPAQHKAGSQPEYLERSSGRKADKEVRQSRRRSIMKFEDEGEEDAVDASNDIHPRAAVTTSRTWDYKPDVLDPTSGADEMGDTPIPKHSQLDHLQEGIQGKEQLEGSPCPSIDPDELRQASMSKHSRHSHLTESMQGRVRRKDSLERSPGPSDELRSASVSKHSRHSHLTESIQSRGRLKDSLERSTGQQGPPSKPDESRRVPSLKRSLQDGIEGMEDLNGTWGRQTEDFLDEHQQSDPVLLGRVSFGERSWHDHRQDADAPVLQQRTLDATVGKEAKHRESAALGRTM